MILLKRLLHGLNGQAFNGEKKLRRIIKLYDKIELLDSNIFLFHERTPNKEAIIILYVDDLKVFTHFC